MRTNNPALNDKIFERETRNAYQGAGYPASPPQQAPPGWQQPGWGAPGAGSGYQGGGQWPPPGAVPPAPDAVSPWQTQGPSGPAIDHMRLGGVLSASAVLLTILLVAGWFGWQAVEVQTGIDITGERVATDIDVPGWFFLSLIGGLVLALVTIFKPRIARFTAPLYAVAQGLLVGVISHVYELQFEGIVLQAVGLTAGVFAVMLFLYATRIIKVTNKLRTGIIAATGAVMLVYIASIVARIFGAEVPFIHESGPVGILFSLAVVGIAAFNLLLDFDFIERGVAGRAPKYMEWYAAFGLLVTLIWLYLELLRLLSKLRSR